MLSSFAYDDEIAEFNFDETKMAIDIVDWQDNWSKAPAECYTHQFRENAE